MEVPRVGLARPPISHAGGEPCISAACGRVSRSHTVNGAFLYSDQEGPSSVSCRLASGSSMRSVLALIGYVVLLGGVLGVLILGGLWASSRFLGDPPSGDSGSSTPVEESVASTSGGDEVSTGTGPGEPDDGGPDAGEAAAGEAATGAGSDAAQPSSAEQQPRRVGTDRTRTTGSSKHIARV